MLPLVSAPASGFLHPHSGFVVLNTKSGQYLSLTDPDHLKAATEDDQDDGSYKPPPGTDDGSYKPQPGLEGEYLEETPADVKFNSNSGNQIT